MSILVEGFVESSITLWTLIKCMAVGKMMETPGKKGKDSPEKAFDRLRWNPGAVALP
jgi:hypothetical protein